MNMPDRSRMKLFSTAELARRTGDVTHAASKAPVTITHHSKPRFVMMSIDDFEALIARPADPRVAIKTDETPPEIAAWLLPALERLASGEGYDDEDPQSAS